MFETAWFHLFTLVAHAKIFFLMVLVPFWVSLCHIFKRFFLKFPNCPRGQNSYLNGQAYAFFFFFYTFLWGGLLYIWLCISEFFFSKIFDLENSEYCDFRDCISLLMLYKMYCQLFKNCWNLLPWQWRFSVWYYEYLSLHNLHSLSIKNSKFPHFLLIFHVFHCLLMTVFVCSNAHSKLFWTYAEMIKWVFSNLITNEMRVRFK